MERYLHYEEDDDGKLVKIGNVLKRYENNNDILKGTSNVIKPSGAHCGRHLFRIVTKPSEKMWIVQTTKKSGWNEFHGVYTYKDEVKFDGYPVVNWHLVSVEEHEIFDIDVDAVSRMSVDEFIMVNKDYNDPYRYLKKVIWCINTTVAKRKQYALHQLDKAVERHTAEVKEHTEYYQKVIDELSASGKDIGNNVINLEFFLKRNEQTSKRYREMREICVKVCGERMTPEIMDILKKEYPTKKFMAYTNNVGCKDLQITDDTILEIMEGYIWHVSAEY